MQKRLTSIIAQRAARRNSAIGERNLKKGFIVMTLNEVVIYDILNLLKTRYKEVLL